MRKQTTWTAVFVLVGLLRSGFCADTLPSFPGAEGFGAKSVGGRGGKVIKVTNLNPSGPGSLQAACSAKGPRIVVFDVSGVIKPKGGKNPRISIGSDRITIAGQTAPGAGITIEGMLASSGGHRSGDGGYNLPGLKGVRHHDITVRFLRLRAPGAGGGGGDCLQFAQCRRMIFDHISCSWASDETVDLNGCQDYTVQWCAIEASDTARGRSSDPWHYRDGDGPRWKPTGVAPHNFGMILGYGRADATVHHTLFAHHNRRTPLCGMDILDHRNNVIYDVWINLLWHPTIYNRRRPGRLFRANVVGNFFKDGPSCPPKYPVSKCGGAKVFARGNTFEGGRFAGGKGAVRPRSSSAVPFPAPPVTTHSAEDAFKLVMAHAGCLPRDAVGKRNFNEVRKGTGSWGRFVPKEGLMEGLTPAKPPADNDNDGMPDEWEKAHNLDPQNSEDANKIVPASEGERHKGYTYIEYYINERADKLIKAAIAEAGVKDVTPVTFPELTVKKSVPELIKELGSNSVDKRAVAMWKIEQMGADAADAAPALAGALGDKDRQIRIRATAALAAMGSAAVPELIKALKSKEKRIAASHTLEHIGPKAKDAVPDLTALFKDEDRLAKAFAALAVFRIAPDTKGLVEALAGSFEDSDPAKKWIKDVRRYVNVTYRLAWALGYLGPKATSASPKLEEVNKWRYGPHKAYKPIERVTRWALDRISGKVPVESQ